MSKCAPAIEAKLGRPLEDREKGQLARQASGLLRKMGAAQTTQEAEAILKGYTDRIKAQGIIAKRTAALNFLARQQKVAMRTAVSFVEKNPSEGMTGMFRGSLYDYEGSKRSLAQVAYHEGQARSNAYSADLLNSKLFDYAMSGKDDDNIGMAIHDIQNGGDGLKYGKDAAATAKIITDHQEAGRLDMNAAGANIEKNNDRLFRRTHDAYKISRAGGKPFGSDEAFQAWLKQGNFDHMDWSKAFDGELEGQPVAEQTKRLKSLFTQFSSGEHLNWSENPSSAARGFGNISTKLSSQRELVWDHPSYDVAYDRAFGRGSSIAEGVFHQVASMGKDIGIMREWGPNPEMNLTRFKDDWSKELVEQGRAKDQQDLEAAFRSEMGNTWNLLRKPPAHPSDGVFARTFAAIRQTTGTAAIGMSVFSNIGDLPLRASQLAMYSDGGVIKNLATDTAHMFTGVGLDKEAQMRLATEAGIRLESAHMPLDPNHAPNIGFDNLAKFNQQVMRMSGHAAWSNRVRTNSLAADAYRFANMQGKDLASLDEGTQRALRQFGINDKEWEVIRQVQPSDMGNGNKGLVTSDILNHDPQAFTSLAAGANPTKAALERARANVASSYRNMMGEMADRSTSAPSIANQAVMQMGRVPANTLMGELMRGALQLKGFAFNYMRNHLGRELYGYAQNKMDFGEAMKTMMLGSTPGGVSARAGLAKLIGTGIMFGYMSNTLRDVAVGKSVEDPTGDQWKDAMARAVTRQSLGLYSDFLMSALEPGQDKSLFDRAGELTGPEFGFANDLYTNLHGLENHVVKQAGGTDQTDNFYKDGQRTFGTLYRNTPGTSLFWTKGALDYLILNNVSENLNPGYQQRLMDRAQKERGQSYLLGGAGPQSNGE
jgi:hypothetical protein